MTSCPEPSPTDLRVGRTTGHTAAALVLTTVVPWHVDNTRRSGKAVLDVLRRLDELALVYFRVRSIAGRLHAGLVVESFDAATSTYVAGRIGVAVSALAPWMEFEVTPFDEDHDLALPVEPAWASRIHRGDIDDERIRASDFSPLANAMALEDSVLSIAVGRSPSADAGLAADLVICSSTGPTDVLAALLPAELTEESNLEIETCHGADAVELVGSHHRPSDDLEVSTFSDVFSLPARASGEVAWNRPPSIPVAPARVVQALESAPSLHRWVLGRTGTGKTTLLRHLIDRDVEAGKTVVVIDPHGGLADDVVRSTGDAHRSRLQFADFGEIDPPAFNPLVAELGEDAATITESMIDSIRSLWDDMSAEAFGPVYERTMRFCLEAVIRHRAVPMISDVVRLISGDRAVIEDVVAAARAAGDESIASAFAGEFRSLGQPVNDGSTSVSTYVLSKLSSFASDARTRRIVDRPTSDVSISDVVDDGKVLVVRLPVGVLGVAPVRAVGQLILARLTSILGQRFESRNAARPVAVYVDEWSLVAEPLLQRLLAEGRKYGFELTLANQSVHQVAYPMKIAGNVGTLALFRVGPAEAALFAPEFDTLTAAGLRLLRPYQVAVRPPYEDEVVGWSPAPGNH